MKQYNVGIVGATGMVGQRFVSMLEDHPWYNVTVLAASARSAGTPYGELMKDRWAMTTPLPEKVKDLVVRDASADAEAIAEEVDFIFCAVDMDADAVKELEVRYATLECPVISNNSAHRGTPDVPMIIPEVNPEHADVIPAQRKRLGTKRGFIAVKSNCSIQSYVPALHPLMEFGPTRVLACTYQAISGAGKTFETWPEMVDNVIPYIGGEEEKSEQEPMKIWGHVSEDEIVTATSPNITAQCFRVAALDGHMAAVFVSFEKPPSQKEILDKWNSYEGEPQKLNLPSAPKKFLHYFEAVDRPQTRLDRDLEHGMGVSIGRLRPDTQRQFDYKFASLSHNTIRGAAGGAVLMAELLTAKGYMD